MSAIFLERFVIAVCGTAFISLIVLNLLKFDWTQRITLGGAIVFMAYFAAHTIEKQRESPPPSTSSTPIKEPPKPEATKQQPPADPQPSKPRNQPKPSSRPLTSLSDGQRFVLKQKLTAYSGNNVRLVRVGGDPQTGIVFEQLIDIFKDANWKIETAEMGTVSVVGANFPNSSYLTGPNIAAPIIRNVFSIFASVAIDLPLTPDAFSGPTSVGTAPSVVIVIK